MKNIKTRVKLTPLLDTLRLQKISDEEYFSTSYADYISNSRLGFIDPDNEGSIQKFLDGFQGNKIYSDSLTLGTVVHEQILQPDLFEICPDLDRPTAKVGFIADEIIKITKAPKFINYTNEEFLQACTNVDYYKGSPSPAKITEIKPKIDAYLRRREEFTQPEDKQVSTFLDSKNIEKAKGCIEALRNNPKVQALLHPEGLLEKPISECEQAILLDVRVEAEGLPAFIVRLKSKLDNYTIDKETNTIVVNDVKTIGKTFYTYTDDGKTKIDNLKNQVYKYHYYREIYMYAYLLLQCARKFYGMENPTIKGNFLWVSTIPTYYTKVTPMKKSDFRNGMLEFQNLLRMAAIALYYKDAVKAEEYFGTL